MPIPIIDLFAGPGGLGEGFSSLISESNRSFEIKLSIEKDENAHKTLELRAFVRQFRQGSLPLEYYQLLQESNLHKRENLREKLFDKYPVEASIAKDEAWLCELGNKKYSSEIVDARIAEKIGNRRDWLLIGGPPCQAYSLVGRSRVGGIDEEDHRVYLYKEYLRIIAKHHPAVFVMENVKGLLSAKLNDTRIFDLIKKDLKDPSLVFPELGSPKYKIYSLSAATKLFDSDDQPVYNRDMDYLIKAEEFGIPQKRHRVILLGIREDIEITPNILEKSKREITVVEVIGDLPKLRSGISKSISNDGLTRYTKESDSPENWTQSVGQYLTIILPKTWTTFHQI